jgi:Ca2+-binding EF-hand superfamily protein
VTATLKRNILVNEKHLDNAFNLIDVDKNGRLSKDELIHYLGGNLS